MLKTGLTLSLIAAAALTACARQPAPTTVIVQPPATNVAVAPANVPATGATQAAVALRAGIGRIESVGPVPNWSASTGAGQSTAMRRVGIRMDDGTLQLIDTDAPSLRTGDRVEITANGFIRHSAQ